MNFTDVTLQVAVIGAFVTFFGSLLAFIVAIIRERFEREKWQRDRQFEREKWERTQQLEESKWQKTLALEDQRVRHEENQWLLDLNNDREREMLKWRMATYPPIFTALGRLSRHYIKDLSAQDATMLADKLNR